MSMTTLKPRIGIGIDTARYGHCASFLRPDRQEAAPRLDFAESPAGYQALRSRIEELQAKYVDYEFHVHIDAGGQYATNLENYLRTLEGITVSLGEPKRNKDYHAAVSPKRKTDRTESRAMARFSVVERPDATKGQSEEFRTLREITARLKVKVRDETRAVNRLHNLLSRTFPELATCVPDVSARWVLTLLSKYPTPDKIKRAHTETLTRIPYASEKKIRGIQQAAANSVASFQGDAAEHLVRMAVEEVQQIVRQRKTLENMMEQAFTALPSSGCHQLTTIPGIGIATAAVLTSKMVEIERFENAEKLVGYFGTFPREESSGVDRQGSPNPSKTSHMSQQGNDLARAYLYSAAQAAARCNPAVRSLYARLRAKGKSPKAAMGHCMRKLLHLVYAVWASNKPFDPDHHPWEGKPRRSHDDADPSDAEQERKNAAGRNRALDSVSSAVTTATQIVEGTPAPVKQESPLVDFPNLRSQISIEQILGHLDILSTLRRSGHELRGPCPIHGSNQSSARSRKFSVDLERNLFHCFSCGAKGNQIDFWAAYHQQTNIREAAIHLAQSIGVPLPRIEKRSP